MPRTAENAAAETNLFNGFHIEERNGELCAVFKSAGRPSAAAPALNRAALDARIRKLEAAGEDASLSQAAMIALQNHRPVSAAPVPAQKRG